MRKLTIWATMLAVVLAVASQALAQESVVATGVLEKPEATTYMYGTHAIVDEASGTYYALTSEGMDLDAYIGQRASVYGVAMPGYEDGQIEGGPPLLDVAWVEPV
jgi:hypothetical protein